MNQEETAQMLDLVAWANRRVDRFGFADVVAIVYTDGAARLLNAAGRALLEEPSHPGDAPGIAIRFLVLRFEQQWWSFLDHGA